MERPRQRLVAGVFRVFAAEMLVIPTGILTVAFLTRRLGPEGYGLLVVAGAVVDWLEWGVTASFTRATVKFVSEADDWRPVASRAIQLQFLISLAVGTGLAVLAGPIAAIMREPTLEGLLRLYALDLPIFCLAQAHRDVLVGLGYYKERALASGCRWIARFGLIVLLVSLGMSVQGAILGGIASSLVELAICRWYVRPGLFGRPRFSARTLLAYVAPLSLYAVSMKVYDKLDLLSYKALGGTAAQAGIYGGAEALTALPTMMAAAFAPLLLSSLGDAMKSGDLDVARARGRQALRAMLLLVPLCGMLPGMSEELVVAMYGDRFLPAAPLFAIMIFAAVAMFIVSVVTSIMVAAGKPQWTFRIIGPLVPAQLIGVMLVVPRYGAVGVAFVTTAGAVVGSVVCLIVVHRLWRISPPAPTVARALLIGLACYLAAAAWATPGSLVFLKFAILSTGMAGVFWWYGDLPGMTHGGGARLMARIRGSTDVR